MDIKTPYDLKYAVESCKSERYFFTRDTMRFFGDTMPNYGLIVHDDCYELYRKKPVKHGLTSSAYFDKKTLKRIFKRD